MLWHQWKWWSLLFVIMWSHMIVLLLYRGKFSRTINFAVFVDLLLLQNKSYCSVVYKNLIHENYHWLEIFCAENFPLYSIFVIMWSHMILLLYCLWSCDLTWYSCYIVSDMWSHMILLVVCSWRWCVRVPCQDYSIRRHTNHHWCIMTKPSRHAIQDSKVNNIQYFYIHIIHAILYSINSIV